MTGLHEIVLRSEEMEVVILPDVGGRIHRIRAFGEDILRTPDDPAMHVSEPFLWGAYVMSPWCNRAASGSTVLAGREIALAANFPDGTAIHGLVSSARWLERSSGELACAGGGDGWPWVFEVSQTASLTGATLTLEYRVCETLTTRRCRRGSACIRGSDARSRCASRPRPSIGRTRTLRPIRRR